MFANFWCTRPVSLIWLTHTFSSNDVNFFIDWLLIAAPPGLFLVKSAEFDLLPRTAED